MWGWQVHQLGDPADVLTWGEMADPAPGAGQVLVRVHAVACNFPDILMVQGKYQVKPPGRGGAPASTRQELAAS